MDRAVAFYRDALGLQVTTDVPFSPNPAIMRLGNTLGAQSRMMQLRVPGSDIGVELIEYKDIDRPATYTAPPSSSRSTTANRA